VSEFTAEVLTTMLYHGPALVLPVYLLWFLFRSEQCQRWALVCVPVIAAISLLLRWPIENLVVYSPRHPQMPGWFYLVRAEYPFDTLLSVGVLWMLTRSALPALGPLVGWWVAIVLNFADAALYPPTPLTGVVFYTPWYWTHWFWADLVNYAVWHGAVIACLAIWLREIRRSRSRFVCSRCGYPLTGLKSAAACPECGAMFGSLPRSGEGT